MPMATAMLTTTAALSADTLTSPDTVKVPGSLMAATVSPRMMLTLTSPEAPTPPLLPETACAPPAPPRLTPDRALDRGRVTCVDTAAAYETATMTPDDSADTSMLATLKLPERVSFVALPMSALVVRVKSLTARVKPKPL